MGLSFAHGTHGTQLSPFEFGDNPGQVSPAKHAGLFQRPAWLYSIFKIQSCQGFDIV
jgi:hypothetical protein